MRGTLSDKALGRLPLLALTLVAGADPGLAETPSVTWDPKIEVASGGGYRGPWRMNKSEFDFVDDPTVAINDRGFVAVAWADHPQHDIFLQVYGPDGKERLEAPVNVSGNPQTFSWLPRMVITSGEAREVYLLWQEIVFSGGSHGGEVFFARSVDGGKTFSDANNLSKSVAGDGKGRLNQHRWNNGSLDLAIGPQGGLYAAWTEYEGNLWFSRSTDRGETFSEPLRIAGGPDELPARGPSLAVDTNGVVYLAWSVGEDEAGDIHFAQSLDRGRSFGAPRIVFDSSGHSDAPKIAVDSAGTVHLVYAESPDGHFQRYHILYTRLKQGELVFEEPRKISGPRSRRVESMSFSALSLDEVDNLYVIWELFPGLRSYSQGLGMTTSSDGGDSFASPSVVPGSLDPAFGFSGSQQGLLMRKLAVNGAGALAVVNSTFKKDHASRIWLTRGQAAGR